MEGSDWRPQSQGIAINAETPNLEAMIPGVDGRPNPPQVSLGGFFLNNKSTGVETSSATSFLTESMMSREEDGEKRVVSPCHLEGLRRCLVPVHRKGSTLEPSLPGILFPSLGYLEAGGSEKIAVRRG